VNREDKLLDQRSLQSSLTGQYGQRVLGGAVLRRRFVVVADNATSDTSCLSNPTLQRRGWPIQMFRPTFTLAFSVLLYFVLYSIFFKHGLLFTIIIIIENVHILDI